LSGIDLADALASSVALGVSIGTLAGKTVGISLFAYLAVRLGIGTGAKSWVLASLVQSDSRFPCSSRGSPSTIQFSAISPRSGADRFLACSDAAAARYK